MFSVQQKREIADAVHRILRDTEHPELPKRGQPIRFQLHVEGAWAWSWADILNNEAVKNPSVNSARPVIPEGLDRLIEQFDDALTRCQLYGNADQVRDRWTRLAATLRASSPAPAGADRRVSQRRPTRPRDERAGRMGREGGGG